MIKVETHRRDEGYLAMTYEVAFAKPSSPARDREVIRIDFSNDRLGIAESLRQAFAADPCEEPTHDFEKLIDELN